jgi:hypothetical protein
MSRRSSYPAARTSPSRPFTWSVCRDGYQWIQRLDLAEPLRGVASAENPGSGEAHQHHLVPRSAREISYAPLEEQTGLFRTFSETLATEEGVLGFATSYGLLGDHDKEVAASQLPGESLKVWADEIAWMRAAVAAWNFLRASKADGTDDLALQRLRELRHEVVHGRALPILDRTASVERGLLVELLTQDVEVAVNAQLSGRVIPRVTAGAAANGVLGLTYEPQSLLGALWLQLASAISDDKSFRTCDFCGRWFEVSPHAKGKSRLFCSDACRAKAYRQRQQEAHDLHERGTSTGEIAEILGSDEATVRGWLNRSPRAK